MTHTLRVTDGTTTVTLSSGDMYITRYAPQRAIDPLQPLKEKCRIRFYRTNASIRANVEALGRLFKQAQNYQSSKTGPRVYVEFDPGDTGTIYRSLIFSATANHQENNLGMEWTNNSLEMEIEWTRQPFWEGPLTQVPLSNSSATNDLSGIAITNANYSSSENWVSIDGTDIEGDLDAPIKVQMLNSKSGANPTDEIYIFHNVYSSPADFTHILEAEDATGGTVTPGSDGTSSGGNNATIAWSGTTETKIAEWALSSALLGYAAGGRFAILARWAELFPYNNCWLRMRLETTTNYYDIYKGDLKLVSPITSGRQLTLLDTVRLPPYLEGLATIRELALTMYGKRATSPSTMDLDYIQLSPISGDNGMLRFKSVARGVPYNMNFVHDDTEGFTYRTDGSNNMISEFAQYGGPVLLVPQIDQKLIFTTSDYQGYAKIDQTWTVKLWYRPRRSSI